MKTGIDFTFESIELFFGEYCSIKFEPSFAGVEKVVGLIYPHVLDGVISKQSVQVYSVNGASQPYLIKSIAEVKIEPLTEKAKASMNRLYQSFLSYNDSLIKLEEERAKMEEKLRKLEAKSEVLHSKSMKQASSLAETLGYISPLKLENSLKTILIEAGALPVSRGRFTPNPCIQFRHYDVYFKHSEKGLTIHFFYTSHTELSEELFNCDFIGRRSDGSFCIKKSNTPDYRAFIAKKSRLLVSVLPSIYYSKEVSSRQSYRLTYSNGVTFLDCASLTIETDAYTKDTVKTAQKALKSMIKH